MTKNKLGNIFVKNISLVKGLMLAPVITVAYTLQNALLISIVFTCFILLSVFPDFLFYKRFSFPLRIKPVLNAVICSILYIPFAYFVNKLMPETVLDVGIMMPLTALNASILRVSEGYRPKKEGSKNHFPALLIYILSFNLTIFVISFIREIFGNGTLWGYHVGVPVKIYALIMPFGGFIICGFAAAVIQKFKLHKQINLLD